jgi:arylsulfatase A-like enzyme
LIHGLPWIDGRNTIDTLLLRGLHIHAGKVHALRRCNHQEKRNAHPGGISLALLLLIVLALQLSCSSFSGTSYKEIVVDFTSPDVNIVFERYEESFAPVRFFEEIGAFRHSREETLSAGRWVRVPMPPQQLQASGFAIWHCRSLFPVHQESAVTLYREGEEIAPLEDGGILEHRPAWVFKRLDYFYPDGIYLALPKRFSRPADLGMLTCRYTPDEEKIRESEFHLNRSSPGGFLRRYVTLGNETRQVLYVPGESRLDFRNIAVPRDGELRFGFASIPYLQGDDRAMLEFQVDFAPTNALPQKLFCRRIEPWITGADEVAERWYDVHVSLREYEGTTGTLSLITRIGTDEGTVDGSPERYMKGWFHRAAWSRPLLVGKGSIVETVRGGHGLQGVVMILIDTVRKDHLGCYGYGRPTSPSIDSLAAGGIIFRNAVSQSSWTRPSVASLFTATYPRDLGILAEDYRQKLVPGYPTLARAFRESGFVTRAIVTNVHLKPFFGLHQGFDAHTFLLAHADGVTDRALEVLESCNDLPFFIYLHYNDPHSPYRAHEEYDFHPQYRGKVFDDPQQVFYSPDRGSGGATEMKAGEKEAGDPEEVRRLTKAELEKMIALYDGEIRFVDHHLGRLFSGLRKMGLSNRIAIVIVSDHGEEFKDHGGYFHGYTLYGEQIDVPLIISIPGAASKDIHTLVQLIDVPVSLCELFGFDVQAEDMWKGTSFISLLPHTAPGVSGREPATRGGDDLMPLNTGAISETWFRGTRKISYATGGEKVIYNYDRDRWELYDLSMDPLERSDRKSQVDRFSPEIEHLREWMDANPPGAFVERGYTDREAKPDQATIDQLRSLGYIY